MYSRKLVRSQIRIERFIEKTARKNGPLEKYRETDDYLAFQNKISDIITLQINYLKAHLSDINIWGDNSMPDHQVEAKVGTYLDQHMPTFKNEMPYDIVYDNLKNAFISSILAQYNRIGVKILQKTAKKVDYSIDFQLTNPDYLAALEDDSNYLLTTKSTGYDQTTKDRLINIVRDGRQNQDTIDEISSALSDQVDGISSVRSFMIANTETANAFGTANNAFLNENNVPEKEWIIAGPHNLVDECDDNANEGPIPSDQDFSSGDANEPAHINCECYTQGVGLDLTTMSDSDLSSLILWDGS